MNMIKAAYFVFVYIILSLQMMWRTPDLHNQVEFSNSKRWYCLIKTNRVIIFEYG